MKEQKFALAHSNLDNLSPSTTDAFQSKTNYLPMIGRETVCKNNPSTNLRPDLSGFSDFKSKVEWHLLTYDNSKEKYVT